jgi:hypothetical protein
VRQEHLQLAREIRAKDRIVLEDQDATDSLTQALFQNADVALIAAPRAPPLFPPCRRPAKPAVNGREASDGPQRPAAFFEVPLQRTPAVAATLQADTDDTGEDIG